MKEKLRVTASFRMKQTRSFTSNIKPSVFKYSLIIQVLLFHLLKKHFHIN